MESFRDISDQNRVTNIPDQRRVFGDGGLPDRSEDIFRIAEAKVRQHDRELIDLLNQIDDAGYDIPIHFLAGVFDLWEVAFDHAADGNYYTDRLESVAADLFDVVFQIVISNSDPSKTSTLRLTQDLLRLGKYAYLIEQQQWTR